jgi:hypothetical protein
VIVDAEKNSGEGGDMFDPKEAVDLFMISDSNRHTMVCYHLFKGRGPDFLMELPKQFRTMTSNLQSVFTSRFWRMKGTVTHWT